MDKGHRLGKSTVNHIINRAIENGRRKVLNDETHQFFHRFPTYIFCNTLLQSLHAYDEFLIKKGAYTQDNNIVKW